jgi:O-antigen/teichoic acid export membrane protein
MGEGIASETHAVLSLFGRNTMWLWLDRATLSLGTMVAGLVLVRYLGPSNYGLYITAISLGALVGTVLDLGLTRYAAREASATPGESGPILALSLFTTIMSVAVEVGALILASTYGKTYIACVCAGLILINLESTATMCSVILTANLRSRAILPGSVLSVVAIIAVIGLVVWQRLSVFALLLGLSMKSLLVASVRLWQLRNRWPASNDWHWKQFRAVAGRAWPYFSYSLTQIGYEKITVVCFGLVATKEQVGWIGAALVVASIFPQWTYTAGGALLPLLTRLFETKRIDELLDLQQRLLDVLTFFTVPVAVLLAAFAPRVCHLLGSQFESSAPVLRIVAYRSMLLVLEGLLGGVFLVAVNRTTKRRNAQAKALILLALLTLIFGRVWGATGAASALLVADIIILAQYAWIFYDANLRMRGLALWTSLIGGMAMAVTTGYLPHSISWVLRTVPPLLVYLAVLVLLARRRLVTAGYTLKYCWSKA